MGAMRRKLGTWKLGWKLGPAFETEEWWDDGDQMIGLSTVGALQADLVTPEERACWKVEAKLSAELRDVVGL